MEFPVEDIVLAAAVKWSELWIIYRELRTSNHFTEFNHTMYKNILATCDGKPAVNHLLSELRKNQLFLFIRQVQRAILQSPDRFLNKGGPDAVFIQGGVLLYHTVWTSSFFKDCKLTR